MIDVSDMHIWDEVRPWLTFLYVVEEKRSRGIGKSLVGHVVQYVREHTFFESMYLWAGDDGLARYYSELGFSSHHACSHGTHSNALIMSHTTFLVSHSETKSLTKNESS